MNIENNPYFLITKTPAEQRALSVTLDGEDIKIDVARVNPNYAKALLDVAESKDFSGVHEALILMLGTQYEEKIKALPLDLLLISETLTISQAIDEKIKSLSGQNEKQ